RLVRRLCRECRESYHPADEVIERLKLDRLAGGGTVQLYRARGCTACGGSGYQKRTTILETLLLNEDLRSLVLKRSDSQTLRRAAIAAGMQTMQENGLVKALGGITSLEEVLRVTQDV
ncbi:MAG: type II secretion system protein GspE, partial [Kiloniellales bacterium]|nr:type II secretion system protein GspE [Kiloniellales bacterium]